MQKNDNELQTLLPEKQIKIGDKTLTVQPFPFAKLPRVMEIVKNVGTDIFALFDIAESGLNTATIAGATDIVVNHFEDVTALMAIYCRIEENYFKGDDFTVEDAILLLTMIIAGHKSFFTQKLMPLIAKPKAD